MSTNENKPTIQTRHPLEPLSLAEIELAVDVLKKQSDKITPSTRFVSVTLREAPKEKILYPSNEILIREADVVLFDNATNSCYEARVSLENQGQLVSLEHIPNVQPTMTVDEQVECEQAVLRSVQFQELIREQYGIDDINRVMIDIWSGGYYGKEEERTRRLARPLCFVRSDPTDNGYTHPIEGLRPVVDLNLMEVIRIEIYNHYPIPYITCNYAADRMEKPRDDIRPLEIHQPEGPSFQINGHQVSWQKWSFVLGFTMRQGLVLHHLTYDNRSVLYRAALSEMVVPYGDPAEQQARKNAFDCGEYGLGCCTNSLELGCDCLGHIKYFDGNMCTSRGELLVIKNAVCLHEEDAGILWKHTDRRLNNPEVRRSRRLVISTIATVENYEYGFYWYLYQDASIQFEVKMTGILSLGAVPPEKKSAYGSLIAPQLFAPYHQHFFNIRLDLAIDGINNTAYMIDVEPDPDDADYNQFHNAFHLNKIQLQTEKQARSHLSLEKSRSWKFENNSVRNAIGEPTGYKLQPGENAIPFGSSKAWWRKRASFVDYHVWVTPFNEKEMFGAGNYPNQSQGDAGLLKYTEQDRSIVDKDIVLWYTFGVTHIPRQEDFPVMPVMAAGFTLKPAGFFDANPANDIPKSIKKEN
jgi:primary-amine oxidase